MSNFENHDPNQVVPRRSAWHYSILKTAQAWTVFDIGNSVNERSGKKLYVCIRCLNKSWNAFLVGMLL